MTQELEQDETQEEPTPAVSPETVIEEEAEEEAAHERETAGDEPTEARGPQMDSEKDVRALGKKLETERKKHADRLSAILGDAAPDALPCPLCFEGLMGFVLPGDAASLPEAQKAAALTFLGQDIEPDLEPAEGVEMCSRCKGRGQLKFPTHVPHVKTQPCPKCVGSGYTTMQPQQAAGTNLLGVVHATEAATNGVVAPCPLCGAVNSAGRAHFCNPVGAGVT